jgi:site-specific recombinase XerD
VLAEPAANERERLALASFLAGYSGLTRDAYALDLRQFMRWCTERGKRLFEVRRADIECFGRELETKGRARATVGRRLCTVAGFYRYAVEEELLDHLPALHVRRPKVDYESHATALDRNEVGALMVAAGLGPAPEHALISLLALNGLRVSEVPEILCVSSFWAEGPAAAVQGTGATTPRRAWPTARWRTAGRIRGPGHAQT